MKQTIDRIIGTELLRGFYPGANLEAIKEAEGEPQKDNSTSYRPYIKYTPEMEKGEDLKVVYYFDNNSIIKSSEIFYNLYPLDHTGGIEAYNQVKEGIIEQWKESLGDPDHKKSGKTDYFQWEINKEGAVYVLDVMTYKSNERHKELGEGHEIIKIVFARKA